MTTLAELADRAQNAISDAGASTWSQSVIEEWCIEAIRDFTQHFTRQLVATISTSADDRQYDLPAGTRTVTRVEYPTDEDPPTYLQRRDYRHTSFWSEDGYYDVLHHDDAGDVAELMISTKPDASETITVTYTADHNLSLDSGDAITVPGRYEPILVEFVVWQAWKELLGAEQQSPTSNSSLLMSQLATNTDRAKRSYVQALSRALFAAGGKSGRARWKMDKHDRVY